MSDASGAKAPSRDEHLKRFARFGAPQKLHARLNSFGGDHTPGAWRPPVGKPFDRLERGGHVDDADLLSGKLTPDGHAVPAARQAEQAEANRRWLAEERQRLAASKGEPVAYAQASAGEHSPGVEYADLEKLLASRKALGNAGETDLEVKAARAQEYAAKLASEYYAKSQVSGIGFQVSGKDAHEAPDTRHPIPDTHKVDRSRFLPTTRADMEARGWTQCDFIFVSGDAYVDHPSFANGVISRVLEWAGFKVGVIAQPNWRSLDDIKRLGAPRLAFLVSAGNLDSMLNAYTAHKLPRSDDPYSPGGNPNARPQRATIVYCNLIRRAFGKAPIIIGGMEASQRRFAHYDYWDDRVRRSILLDSNADMLVFGMGETQIAEIAHRLNAGEKIHEINDVRGTAFVRKDVSFLDAPGFVERFGKAQFTMAYETLLPPRYQVSGVGDQEKPDTRNPIPDTQADRVQEHQDTGPHTIPAWRKNYAITFKQLYDEQDPVRGRPVVQPTGALHVIQLPPARLQSEAELDRWYDLPYTRMPHPDYEAKGGVPAWLTTQHTIVTHRGCMGSCTFCAIWMHQGRTISSRSIESIEREAQAITHMPGFKGYISDVGGPTANMYGNYCSVQQTLGACKERDCLLPDPCPALRQHLDKQVEMLSRVRAVPGVKKAFIASGIRYDMLIDEKTTKGCGDAYIENLAAHHTSGHLKVAPEHTSDQVLARMRKPSFAKYEIFKQRFVDASKRVGKEQYLVAYFVSSHPGCTMDEQIALAEYFKKSGWSPEQVQDFIPTPMTPATAMFYSGFDPETMQYVYTPTTMREKRRQRALMQFKRPEFQGRVRKALREAGRKDLIGKGPQCLVPPGNEEDWEDDNPKRPAGIGSGPQTMLRRGSTKMERRRRFGQS